MAPSCRDFVLYPLGEMNALPKMVISGQKITNDK
jgi:hypothetical protein